MENGPNLIAINVGNTRTHIGRFATGTLEEAAHLPNDQVSAIVEQIVQWWPKLKETSQPTLALASVNDPVADRIGSAVEDQLGEEVYRVGDDLPIPIGTQLDPETLTGVDRLLNAAVAYHQLKQAVIVVDAGSAVTVDFVDGEGTFHGGAIAPGASMQLRSLHDHTAALPEITLREPDEHSFGRSTAQAMLHGVFHGIRGMIWKLVEHFSEEYGAFPFVLATGGDAEVLFAKDKLINRVVPDLTLQGICLAVHVAINGLDAVDDASSMHSAPDDDE